MAKNTKIRPTTQRDPKFEPGRSIGGFDHYQILADSEGRLWHVDIGTGYAKRVTFESPQS